MNQYELIKNLIPFLPEKDISLGYKFLESRNLESLINLVDSALIKISNKKQLGEDVSNIDIDKLETLKATLDCYAINYYEENRYYDMDANINDVL